MSQVCTVRSEIITESILERAGPVIFKTFLLEFIAFRLITVIYPTRRAKPEDYWKRLLIPDRAFPTIKSVIFQKLNSWKYFSGSATIWVPTVVGTKWPPFTFLRSCAVSASFLGVHSRSFSATRMPNSHNHSHLHYSLSKFTGEGLVGSKTAPFRGCASRGFYLKTVV